MPTTHKLIAKNILGSDTASVAFSSIPSTYTDLCIVASTRQSDNLVTAQYYVQFNSDTSAAYQSRFMQGYGTGTLSQAPAQNGVLVLTAGSTATANAFGSAEVYIPNYTATTQKSVATTGVAETNAAEAYLIANATRWSGTAAITSITIVPTSSTNFKSGSSFFLYGITKA